MIKVAITGADTPQAGELIRILINHPEVKFAYLSAPGCEGMAVNSIHYGLIGDLDMCFSGPLPGSPDCSVVFVCGNSMTATQFEGYRSAHPDLRMIAVDPIPNLNREGVVLGLPEVNRKALVRGAMASMVPSAITSAIVVALFPLAVNLLLNDSVEISAFVPKGYPLAECRRGEEEAQKVLQTIQSGFTSKLNITTEEWDCDRAIKVTIKLNCSTSLDQIFGLYDTYEDHNFSFAVMNKVEPDEVVGTDRIIVSVHKENDSQLILDVVLDPKMRGSSGDAVHNMNLLFGLHEKTGLNLKAH